MKFISPLTKELSLANWKEKIDLKALSLDEMTDLLGDLRNLEKLGKKVGGFIKEAVYARVDREKPTRAGHYEVVVNHVVRKGGLDEAKIIDDMGEEWLAAYRKDDIEYDEVRLEFVEDK